MHRDIDLTNSPADRDYVGARFKCRGCAGKVEITLSQIVTGNDAHLPTLEWCGARELNASPSAC